MTPARGGLETKLAVSRYEARPWKDIQRSLVRGRGVRTDAVPTVWVCLPSGLIRCLARCSWLLFVMEPTVN